MHMFTFLQKFFVDEETYKRRTFFVLLGIKWGFRTYCVGWESPILNFCPNNVWKFFLSFFSSLFKKFCWEIRIHSCPWEKTHFTTIVITFVNITILVWMFMPTTTLQLPYKVYKFEPSLERESFGLVNFLAFDATWCLAHL